MAFSETQAQLARDIRLLGGILGEVIERFEGKALLDRIERTRKLAQKARLGDKQAHRGIEKELQHLTHAQKYKVAKAFTEFLRLANLAEQTHRIRRRQAHRVGGSVAQRASPLDTFTRLRENGVSPAEIKAALRDAQIELVMTAHPTEAMMPQAIRAYRDLSFTLLKLDSPEHDETEKELMLRDVRSIITQLWLSGVVRERKPTPVDEARYGLEFAERILWRAVTDFHHQMSAAYKIAVGDMSDLFPRPIRFASWMGGDRDGHPGVTAKITRRVLQETTNAATARYLGALKELREAFPLDHEGIGLRVQKGCLNRIAGMEKKLRGFKKDVNSFTRRDFLDRLYSLQEFLKETGADAFMRTPLQELIWRVRIFGLCFLKLDIRQSADIHAAALAELLPGYATAGEAHKIRLISSALKRGRGAPKTVSKKTAEVLDTLRLYRDMPHEFLGPYIISMAAQASDLLGVMYLMKVAGVESGVPICPLFETPASLESAREVMESLYRLPAYRRHAGKEQQIMLGYSDSSKRGGYIGAAWEIYRLQSDLLAIGKKHGIRTTFFHGRGGSVARGGGPIETALLALPRPHLTKRIRVTEQGEAIEAKFGLPGVAQRTMELYLSGFMEAILLPPPKIEPAWTKVMERLARTSSAAFRKAVYEEPDFMAHYNQLTPTGELGLLKIGSRPGRRKKDGGLESLRAIPWVFGWTQSRTLLPAWLGVGDALQAEIKAGNLGTLQAMYKNWPFFNAMIDLVEMTVAKADPAVTEYYSALLVEPELQWLTKEYLVRLADTRKTLLKVVGREELLSEKQVLARSIRLRTPYVDVLNILQAHLLKEYRSMSRPPRDLRRTLALTIGGISAGMRNTG